MKADIRSKGLCILLSVILIAVLMPGIAAVYAEQAKPVVVTRTVNTTSTNIGEKFTVTYHITGDEILIPRINKDIAVVIDCSGSMDSTIDGKSTSVSSQKRITIAKEAAKNFVSYFNNTYSKIFVLPYSGYAGSVKAISNIVNMHDAASLTYLQNYINGLSANGSTNTGDALRMAYYKLKTEGTADAKKYIVLLTDGEPHGYTYYMNKNNGYYMGQGVVNNSTILKDDSDSKTNDTFTKGYLYSKNIGAVIHAENSPTNKIYNAFIIGFAQNDNSVNTYDKSGLTREQRLEQIGLSCGSAPVPSNGGQHFYKALTVNDLNNTYNMIKDIISDTIPFSFMHFSDILPFGVDIDDRTKQILIGKGFDIETITYKGENRVQLSAPLNTILRHIRSDPGGEVYKIDDTNLSFEIQVVATKDGVKNFEKNLTSIDYTYSLPDGTAVSDTAYNAMEQNVNVDLLNSTISLPPNTTLLLGKSKTLEAVLNNPDINKVKQWSANPAGIISLSDNGNNSAAIAGINLGLTAITATTQSTNGWYKQETASCNVNVVDVNLGDMYVLKDNTAGGIPLNLILQNPSGTPFDLQVTDWSADSEHNGFIQVNKADKSIKGLKSTGSSPVNLSLKINVEGQEKTLNARVHVLDVDISPETMTLSVFETKRFGITYSTPDEAFRDKFSFSCDFNHTNDGNYVTLNNTDPSQWTVKGIKLNNQTATQLQLKVVIRFEDAAVSPAQEKIVQRTINLQKPLVDIN